MKHIRPTILAAALALSFGAIAEESTTSGSAKASNAGLGRSERAAPSEGDTKASADKHYWDKIAIGNRAEIELGKLALKKAADPEVKAFAQRMVDEHGKKETEFLVLAKRNGVTPPKELDAKHKDMMAQLQGLSGAEFDAAYQAQMVAAHQEMAALLQETSDEAQNAELKGFAMHTLPAVQDHEKHASTLDADAGATAQDTND
jgi:putative membrane protein